MNAKATYTLILTAIMLIAVILFIDFRKAKENFPVEEIGGTKEESIVITGNTYFVSPSGNDGNDGRSEASPFLNIQKAVGLLMPGDGVVLAEGVYFQDIMTVRDGSPGNLIVIKGSKQAIVKGTGEKDRVIGIGHSYIALNGFTVDGFVADGKKEKRYRDKLVYAESTVPLQGVTGLRIISMHLANAGGECLRLKYFAHENEVAYNTIIHCGAYDFLFDGGGKNGEGIYIGTAPEQVRKGKNATKDRDTSNNNWIHGNIINTQGNECIDVKEGSSGNLIEDNSCTGQKDSDSAGLDSRGNGNIFRRNEVFENVGAGIRLGGDKDGDGIDNIVADNYLHGNHRGGIKIQRQPQKQICGNRLVDNKKGDLVGEYGSDYENAENCGDVAVKGD